MLNEPNTLLSLRAREQELQKIKIFQEVTYNDDLNPTQATFHTYDGKYILVFTSIHEKRKALAQFFISLNIDGKRFFIIRIPEKSEYRIKLYNLLDSAEIQITRELTISYNSSISLYNRAGKDIPRNWADKYPLLRDCLMENLKDFTYYNPPKIPIVPLFMHDFPSAENFLKIYNKNPYEFYSIAICLHLMHACGIQRQTTVKTVLTNITTIRKYLPDNLLTDKFIEYSKIFFLIENVEKSSNGNILITFNADTYEQHKNRQYIQVPLKLLPFIFKSNSFGKNGLAYFLMVMFGYHTQYNKMNYKPSTIIKLAHINLSRGRKYTVDAINRPLQYLKELGIIRTYTKLTLEAYKKDCAIKFYLNKLDQWQPPEKN